MKTIKDIAEEAKVSTGTVDRVIHGRPGVSPKTRAKIQKLLDKHSFERNVLASTLASKKKYSIATLIPLANSEDEFWHEPAQGIALAMNEIKRYGFKTHCFFFDKFDLQSYIDAFDKILKLSPNGVVLAPFFYKTSVLYSKKLTAKKIPYVSINIDLDSKQNLSYIGQNSLKSGVLSGKLLHLMLKEECDIGIIRAVKNVDHHKSIEGRVKGFLNYFNKNSIKRTINDIFLDNFDLKEVNKVLTKEFNKNNIRGLFVPSSSAFVIAKYLEANNMKDISLIGFDAHSNNLSFVRKGVINFLIDQSPFEQGYKGVKILFEFLLFDKYPDKEYSSPINIVTQENEDYYTKVNGR